MKRKQTEGRVQREGQRYDKKCERTKGGGCLKKQNEHKVQRRVGGGRNLNVWYRETTERTGHKTSNNCEE